MAAQDAELKLKVSLDLGFFRQQLAGLGQAAAGYNMPVQVKFDRRSVQNELNALGANIRRRTYTLNVNTNLKAEIDNAKNLARELENLGRVRSAAQSGIRQQMGMGALLPGPQSGGISSKEVGKLYKAAAKAGLLEYSQEIARTKASMVAALESIGRSSVEGLLNGLTSQNEQLKTAASSIGESLIKTIKGVLGIASPSREFRKIGEEAGKGFEIGLLRAMEIAEQSASRQMRRMLDRLARMALMVGGMSAAEISRQVGQSRALPGVNFPATVPQRSIPIGPSSTGRALPPGATRNALPGTAFGAQRYLPTALSDELKQILRGAAFAFVDSIRTETRSVRIGIGASMQGMLPAARIAGLLPAGVGREPSRYATGAIGGESREQMMARRTAEAYARSALRGMDAMGGGAGRPPSPYSYAYRSARPTSAIVPYAQAGAIVPSAARGGGGGVVPPSGGGGRGGFGGMGGFASAMGGINLPGAGVIRELGSEFGYATKQVLLFGQAYKLLGFLQSFPGQVGAAVGQLQSFRNTLGAISPTAEEAAASNQLILDLVDKYNVPLQSARDGFTKLYASMAPAGFSGDEVRNLFTGITQAAATFGMSADKVDRVNYAFAQMASKGQVMSEELKGQLGDVLPGAMALFAKAAGFEGPKAIQDFSAALEDGAYKGEAMVALLKNVGVVMKQEFGPGAEGAALTFQGVINRMQNSMTLLYESFEPVAVGFLNTVVVPLTSGIKTISDGFNAFFTGAAAQTSGGFGIAQELERLRPAFDGIGNNVRALIDQFGQFARIALEVGKVLLQIASNPLVGYLVKIYAIALPLNIALGVMRGLWAANAVQLLLFNARVATGTSTLTAFRGMMAATGATAQATAASIRNTGITLRTFFAATGMGLVITGISALIERIMTLNQKMEETRQKAMGAASAIRMMSGSEARAAEQSYAGFARSLEGLNNQLQAGQLKGKAWISVNRQQQAALEAAGVIPSVVRGQAQVQPTRISGAYEKLKQLESEASYRQRQVKFDEQQAQKQSTLAPIPASEGEGGKGSGRQLSVDDLIGGEIKRNLDEKRSKLEVALARELNRAAAGINPEQAERMVKSAAKLLDIKYQINAIDQTLTAREGVRAQIIASSKDKAGTALAFDEQTNDLKATRANLERDIEKAIIEQQGAAEQQARKEREEIEEIRKEQAKRIAENIKGLQDEIALLRAISDEEQRRIRIAQENENATPEQLNQIYDLEKVRDNIKAVRETIDSFVTETSSDYKGFLKEVISGEDAVESLKKFQEGLKDRVLTIFLDFAMAPVEKFFKEGLTNLALDNFFPKGAAEGMPEEAKPSTTPIEAQDKNTTATDANTEAVKANTAAMSGTGGPVAGGNAYTPQSGNVFSADYGTGNVLQLTELGSLTESANAYSEQLGQVDASVWNSAMTLGQAGEQMGPNGAAGKTWQQSLGGIVGGLGMAAGSIMGIMAGIQQIKEGGTSNVLGGIGMIASMAGSLLGGFSGLFGGGSSGMFGTSSSFNGTADALGAAPFAPKLGAVFANGGIVKGGFRAFANGGIVNGPTLGLMGEGKYNEAVVPLPDGRSIPVQLGGRSARDLMGGGGTTSSQSLSLNMQFETTKINGVEYVSRDQLEAAMAETRRASISGGAKRGMSMTLDRLKQSPSTRSNVGIR